MKILYHHLPKCGGKQVITKVRESGGKHSLVVESFISEYSREDGIS